MDTLFPIEPVLPEGFQYHPGFLTADEENYLISEIEKYNLTEFIFHGYTAKRKTQSFGYDYSFTEKQLKPGIPIPDFFKPLINKVALKLNIPVEDFRQVLIIEYPPDAVINWHRDAPPFDKVAGVSLKSECTFRFRPYDKHLQNRKSIISLPVKPRSLYLIDGNARSEWEHSTHPVKKLRYSITLRTLK